MQDRTDRSLRRSSVGGALGLACLALLVPVASAATTPTPDPPPLDVAPDVQPAAPAPRAPVATRSVVTSAPVVTRTVVTPVIVTREVPVRPATTAAKQPQAKAKPKPKPAAAKPAPKPEQEPAPVRALPPHDRHQVPLARFVPTVEKLNRGLVAFAGAGLGFVALGGAVVLLAARRQFGELAG